MMTSDMYAAKKYSQMITRCVRGLTFSQVA